MLRVDARRGDEAATKPGLDPQKGRHNYERLVQGWRLWLCVGRKGGRVGGWMWGDAGHCFFSNVSLSPPSPLLMVLPHPQESEIRSTTTTDTTASTYSTVSWGCLGNRSGGEHHTHKTPDTAAKKAKKKHYCASQGAKSEERRGGAT